MRQLTVCLIWLNHWKEHADIDLNSNGEWEAGGKFETSYLCLAIAVVAVWQKSFAKQHFAPNRVSSERIQSSRFLAFFVRICGLSGSSWHVI